MVYIFLAEGFEIMEMTVPLDMMRRAGLEVNTISISDAFLVKSAQGVPVEADDLFDNTDFSDAQLLVLPGGLPGSDYLYAHKGLKNLLREFLAQGGPVGAICAAPTVLGRHGFLEGRKATCYPGCEGNLKGAQYTASFVEQDGNIITACGPAASVEFAGALIRLLCGQEVLDKIRGEMQFSRM